MDVDYGTSHMGEPIYSLYGSASLCPMETIGQRIRQRRTELGMTRQADLAELVGVDQSTISDIERGANTRPENLLRLAEVLRTTPEWLVRGTTAKPAAPVGWPFRTLTAQRLAALTPAQLAIVEKVALVNIEGMEALSDTMPLQSDTGRRGPTGPDWEVPESKVETDGERDRVEASQPKRRGDRKAK